MRAAFSIVLAPLLLSGCLAGAAVETAGAVVVTTAKVAVGTAGAVVDVVTPDGRDEDEDKKKKKD
jgi:hypothetical protein